MALNTADEILNSVLPEWHKLLERWAADGSLVAAAQEALMLPGEPEALKNLVAQWSAGDFSGIPRIVLLPSADINGALGAYAISTGTIYLNADWLAGASKEQMIAVLTEELGHHLDGLLNAVDTPGDEGEYFSKRLLSSVFARTLENQAMRPESDFGIIFLDDTSISAEQSSSQWSRILDNVNTTFDYTRDFIQGAGSGRLNYILGTTVYGTDGRPARDYRLLTLQELDGTILADTPIAFDGISKPIEAFNVLANGSYALVYSSSGTNFQNIDCTLVIVKSDLTPLISVSIGELSAYSAVSNIIQDKSGNIYLAGTTFKDLLGQKFNGANDLWGDAFVLKISAAGMIEWARLYGGSRGETATSLFLTESGDLALTGETNGSFAGLPYSESRRPFATLINTQDGSIRSVSAGNDEFVNAMVANGLADQAPYITQSDGNNSLYISNKFPLLYPRIGGFLSAYALTINGSRTASAGIYRDQVDPSIRRPLVLSSDAPVITILNGQVKPSIQVSGLSATGLLPNGYTVSSKLEYLSGSSWFPLIDISAENQPAIDYASLKQAHGSYIRAAYTFSSIAGDSGWLRSEVIFLPPQVTLTLSSTSVTEDGITNLVYTFNRTGATTSALKVNYTIGGTATLGTDYTGIDAATITKTVTFAAGSATAVVTVDPTADASIEPNETVELTITAGTGYTIGTPTPAVGTITNDDVALPSITLTVSPSTVIEDGTANLLYTFSRTGTTTNPLTVNYTVGGTATLSSDYTGISSTPATKTVAFAAGSATAIVTVDPTDDASIEPDETVELTITPGTGYIIGTTTAVSGKISNDDFPSITLAVAPASVAEDGTANLLYTFSRTGITTNPLKVDYIVGGAATLGSDYTGISDTTPTVTFAAGSTTTVVTIDPTADAGIEPDETVELSIRPGTGYTIGTTTAVSGTISDDDSVRFIPVTGNGTTIINNTTINNITNNINSNNTTTNNINNSLSITGSFNGNTSAQALAGSLKLEDPATKTALPINGDSAIKTLAQLTASKPLSDAAKQLLDRYIIKDPSSSSSRKASADDAGFIDFTLKTGSLKSLTAEIALASEVKATAYVKVNPNTGEAYDFTFDPVTGLGAELLDTNKNGLVDSLRIHLQDGAKGDVDGLINGEIRDPGVLADAPRQSVYRFFKASKGVHLYTSSEAERANVNANPGWGYKDEGVAYEALVTQGKALRRFFNAKASYHFMTTNEEEAKNINANPQWGFKDEGTSFSVSTVPQFGMSTPVNRFYRVVDGVGQHFYTASADEANNILANPQWGYKSEGVGWYV